MMGLSTSENKTNEAIETLRGFFRGVPKGGKTKRDRPAIWLDAIRALNKIEDIIADEEENG